MPFSQDWCWAFLITHSATEDGQCALSMCAGKREKVNMHKKKSQLATTRDSLKPWVNWLQNHKLGHFVQGYFYTLNLIQFTAVDNLLFYT